MIVRLALRISVWLLALMSIASYLWLGIHRVSYPLEIDWIEGCMTDHISRIAHGLPIYVEPSLKFIPLAYMPFFTVVSGGVAHVFGEGFWAGRMVSFLSSVLLSLLIAGIVLAETKRPTLAIAASGIHMLAFGFTGACYDIARPDSLMLLLTFSGLAILRWSKGLTGAMIAAVLLTLGFFTKQHSLIFSMTAMCYLAVSDRRRLVPFGLAMLVGCLGGYMVLNAWLGRWFHVFTWSIPRGWSTFSRASLQTYIGKGLFGALAAMTVPSILSLGLASRPSREGTTLWYWAGLGAIGTGLLATLDPWAYKHVFTPTVVAFVVLGPIALERLSRQLEAGSVGSKGFATTAIYAVAAVQFLPLLYPVHSEMPRRHAHEAHQKLLALIRSYPGDVMVPNHGWYTAEAGKSSGLQMIALDDIIRSRGNELIHEDRHFLDHMFAKLASGPGRPVLIMDRYLELNGSLWAGIAHGYRLADSLDAINGPLTPVTGNQMKPSYVYVPIEDAAAGPDSTSAPATVAQDREAVVR